MDTLEQRVVQITSDSQPLVLLCRLCPRLGEIDGRGCPRHQLTAAQGFYQVVVGSILQTLNPRILGGARGQQDDGNRSREGILTQLTQQRQSVDVGHHDVGDDEIRWPLTSLCQRGLTV